jgi:hypothetical protein
MLVKRLHPYLTSSIRQGRRPLFFLSHALSTGIPQGSVLGPPFISIYTSPIAFISSSYCIHQQQYADDIQFYISRSDYTHDVSNLEDCLTALYSWFGHNGLSLNPDKSDYSLWDTAAESWPCHRYDGQHRWFCRHTRRPRQNTGCHLEWSLNDGHARQRDLQGFVLSPACVTTHRSFSYHGSRKWQR